MSGSWLLVFVFVDGVVCGTIDLYAYWKDRQIDRQTDRQTDKQARSNLTPQKQNAHLQDPPKDKPGGMVQHPKDEPPRAQDHEARFERGEAGKLVGERGDDGAGLLLWLSG